MKVNEYRGRITAEMNRDEADAIFRDIYRDSDLMPEEVGAILGELLRSDAIVRIGEEMKQEWIAKGMTKEQVNAGIR